MNAYEQPMRSPLLPEYSIVYLLKLIHMVDLKWLRIGGFKSVQSATIAQYLAKAISWRPFLYNAMK